MNDIEMARLRAAQFTLERLQRHVDQLEFTSGSFRTDDYRELNAVANHCFKLQLALERLLSKSERNSR